jgi:hypothetical protein
LNFVFIGEKIMTETNQVQEQKIQENEYIEKFFNWYNTLEMNDKNYWISIIGLIIVQSISAITLYQTGMNDIGILIFGSVFITLPACLIIITKRCNYIGNGFEHKLSKLFFLGMAVIPITVVNIAVCIVLGFPMLGKNLMQKQKDLQQKLTVDV